MDRHKCALEKLKRGTIIPAIPLALTAQRELDETVQRRLVRYYLEAGVGGIATAVHTTQFQIHGEKSEFLEPVLRIVAEEIRDFETENKTTLVRVAGVCGDTAHACQEAALAKKLGYDAVLVSPNGLQGATEEDLLKRTAAIAEVLPVIGFYLQEAVGGRKLSKDYWKAMADIPGVIAIKCACFDRYRTQDLVKGVMESTRGEDVALYTGNDDHIVFDLLTPFTCVANGERKHKHFVGGLLGQWSCWTKTAVELFHACKECQKTGTIPSELLGLGERLTECNGAIFDVANHFSGCIAGIHYVLQKQGLLKGCWCLDPEEGLSPGQAEEIDQIWRLYPEIADDPFVREFLYKDTEC